MYYYYYHAPLSGVKLRYQTGIWKLQNFTLSSRAGHGRGLKEVKEDDDDE